MKTTIKLSCFGALIVCSGFNVVAQNPAAVVGPKPNVALPKLEGLYQGTWVTTKNKKLNGNSNCQLQQIAKDRWKGRFWGIWQQVPFDYMVEFGVADSLENAPGKNTPENPQVAATAQTAQNDDKTAIAEIPVAGTAMIDGARYDWVGQLSAEEFKTQFTGNRYEGSMHLKRAPDKKPVGNIALEHRETSSK